MIEGVWNFDWAWTERHVIGTARHRERKSRRVHRASALPICYLGKTGIGAPRRSFGRTSAARKSVARPHVAFRLAIFVLQHRSRDSEVFDAAVHRSCRAH